MFFRCRNDDASKESLFSGGWTGDGEAAARGRFDAAYF